MARGAAGGRDRSHLDITLRSRGICSSTGDSLYDAARVPMPSAERLIGSSHARLASVTAFTSCIGLLVVALVRALRSRSCSA